MPSPVSTLTAAAPAVAHSRLKPLSETERLNSVDVIRGVALLGILLMNITAMGLPDQAYEDPTVRGGYAGWNLRTWMATNLFFEGTMRAMFSMLFGAGVLLFTGKDEEKGGLSIADAWYRRTIWLFVFGLIHAYVLLWPGDILYSYGLMGMFLFPLRKVAPVRLFAGGVALLVVGAAFYLGSNQQKLEMHAKATQATEMIARGETPNHELKTAQKDWERLQSERKPSAEDLVAIIEGTRAGYFSAFTVRAENTTAYRSYWHYRYDYFDILSMMLIGMALFKWRVFHAALSTRAYLTMIAIGYPVGLVVNWNELNIVRSQNFSVFGFTQSYITYDLGRVAMMTGHIGLIMLVCRLGALTWLTQRIGAVGRMALTSYISHTVITSFVFVGLAQYGQWERHQLYYLVGGIWLFQIIASPIWLRHFYFGPLEWAWRRLTYLAPQPFRR